MKSSIQSRGKRLMAVLLILLILITALPFSVSAATVSATTTAGVHLRSGAGTSYESKKVLSQGTAVTVTDMSNPEWYAVQLADGTTGYVSAEYLSISSEIPAKTNEYVNLRSGPGTSYASKQVVKSGTSLTVTSTSNKEWYAVRLSDGTTGYIYSIYLDLGNTASQPTATPTATPAPSASATAAPTPAGSSTLQAVTTDPLHLRSGPGTSYSSKGVISAGTTVTVTEKTNSEWYAVKLSDGKTGYMFTAYLKMVDNTSAKESVEAKTTTYVHLRSGPGTDYYSMGVIPTDTKLTVTDRSNKSWYAVKLSDGRTGYMYSTYLEITKTAATPTPTPTAKPTAAPTSTTAPTPTPSAGKVIVKTTAALNLRSGPGTSYSKIMVVEKGTSVTVTEIANDDWYKVRLDDGTAGYFASEYLQLVSGDLSSLTKNDPDEGGGNAGGNAPTETKPSGTEYVRTTVSDLNFRTGPGTEYSRIRFLGSGEVLEVLARTDNGWVKVKANDGTVGYVSAQYVSAYDPSSGQATLPEDAGTLPRFKTLYLDADTSGTVYWSSSNTSVATVDAGTGSQVFIYGVNTGTATISAKNASGTVLASTKVTVTAPEPVRFAYTTPNVISAGKSFDLIAVTDTLRSAVKFEIQGLSSYETTKYTAESEGDNSVRVFKAAATINEPGTYTVRAYSKDSSGYSGTYKEFTILVVSTSDTVTTTNESRRISDQMLNAVALFEGYCSTVYADTLAGNIPTVGYGYVVNENTSFYNSLTETEAMAMLADTLNQRAYTSEVNKFIANNNIKMNQQQFDALVSFSYNVGAGYWNSDMTCYLRTVLLNTVAPLKDLSASNPYSGTVSASSIVMYGEVDGGYTQIATLSKGASVSIVEFYRDNSTAEAWYKVKSGGNTGWVRSGNITVSNASGMTRDLACVDAYTFANNLLEWHIAGNVCREGLYYRRLAEAKVFAYGNYKEATMGNANYKVNTYGFEVPSCMSNK